VLIGAGGRYRACRTIRVFNIALMLAADNASSRVCYAFSIAQGADISRRNKDGKNCQTKNGEELGQNKETANLPCLNQVEKSTLFQFINN